jgi:hypothetical protein
VALPAGVPAEVAARGEPEQVVATDEEQWQRNRTLVRVVFGLLALLLLAVAGFHLYTVNRPLQGYDLPRDVALGVGVGTGILALVLAALAVVLTSDSVGGVWWGPRVYLVYEDVLVELRAGGYRAIPWETVGEGEINTLVDLYRFPVAGGRALSFDGTVRNHQAFAATIKERAAQRHSRVTFGEETGLDEMRNAEVGPSIMVRSLGMSPRDYRITLLGEHLLFYHAGWSVLPDHAPTPIVNFGLIGGAISGFNAAAHAYAQQKAEEERRRVEAADAPSLVRFAQEREGSFVASRAEVRAIRLDPPSEARTAAFLAGTTGLMCVLHLEHAHQGKLSLAVLSPDDVLTIVREWAKVFGDVIEVNIAWSHSRCAFVPWRDRPGCSSTTAPVGAQE